MRNWLRRKIGQGSQAGRFQRTRTRKNLCDESLSGEMNGKGRKIWNQTVLSLIDVSSMAGGLYWDRLVLNHVYNSIIAYPELVNPGQISGKGLGNYIVEVFRKPLYLTYNAPCDSFVEPAEVFQRVLGPLDIMQTFSAPPRGIFSWKDFLTCVPVRL